MSDRSANAVPDPVSDAKVAAAQAALRAAWSWGAEYYEPRMYAGAKGILDSALAQRHINPTRCLSLLDEATEAAASTEAATLRDYEADVKSRFVASRAQLVESGADLAFPNGVARLSAGIVVAVRLFAAGSFNEARLEAHETLKGMSELADRARSLSSWLRDAQAHTERAIEAARALGASRWAAGALKDAERGYQDAVTYMQAGNLTAAVDSMRTAGQTAARLPLLGAAARNAAEAASLEAGSVRLPEAAVAPPQSPSRSRPVSGTDTRGGQQVRIGNVSMSALDGPSGLYPAFSATVARFDVVAAEGLRDSGTVEKVLAGLDESWEAAVSKGGYFGFLYSDRVQLVRDLGAYPQGSEFLHLPYAAQFRLAGTRFLVNLVLCHIETGRGPANEAVARLARVYRYFENLTGNRGITILLAGGLPVSPGAGTAIGTSAEDLVPLRTSRSTPARQGTHAQGFLAGGSFHLQIVDSGSTASTPSATYVTLRSDR